MATQADLDRAFAWAKAQVGKPYVLGNFGDSFDCSTYMSGIATMIRDGVAKRWFTTHPFHSGAFSPLEGWERNLEAPFMIGITDEGIGHTSGTLLGVHFEAARSGIPVRSSQSSSATRGARDPYYKYVYGFRPSLLENAPVGQVTAPALKAMASGGTKISNGNYSQGSTSSVPVMQKNGAVFWTSGMSIDCDGQPGSRCNLQTDPYFQPNTSWNQSNGQPLSAENLPFIVVPLPSNVWDYKDAGIVGGNLCTIVYKDKYIHAVVGDQGPSGRIGEASYAAAEALGIPSSPTSGGTGSGVTYIVYPGVRVNPIESASKARELGEIEAAKWLGVTAVPDKHVVKAGETFTGIASQYGVSPDELSNLNNLLKVGDDLAVVDPVLPPDPEPEITTYTAVAGDTWESIADKFDISVNALMELNNIKVAVGSSYIVKKDEPAPEVDPYLNGLPQVGETSPSAKDLQAELKRVGYVAEGMLLDDTYGPQTQQGVINFHNDNPSFRTSLSDPQIGTMGWAHLRGMADGSGKIVASATPSLVPVNDVLYVATSHQTGRTFAEETIRTTLALMGLPVTSQWVDGYLTMALRESSYNPNAVNTWDTNAKNVPEINGGRNVSDGHPGQCSRGMWQCIPQTFARYHQSGTSLSIYDPVASCAASINYVRAVYGVSNDGSNLAAKVQQADPNRNSKGY